MDNLLSMKELLVSLRKNWWLALCTLLLGAADRRRLCLWCQETSLIHQLLWPLSISRRIILNQ